MTAVLGIDAAWTVKEPSGVALLSKVAEEWRCVALAPSYDAYYSLADGKPISWSAPVTGSAPDPARVLSATKKMLGNQRLAVVTVDMPVADVDIVGRREADDSISRAFGGSGCGAHSPNERRPGVVSTTLRAGFGAAGYELATANTSSGSRMRLVEVYPHPALLRLMNKCKRIPYKVGKSNRYYPDTSVLCRTTRLLDTFSEIIAVLGQQIDGITLELPDPAATSLSGLKRYEDAIDALICAWVGVMYLAGNAAAFGDENAAIWVPCPSATTHLE